MAGNRGFGVVTRRDAVLAGTGAASPVAVGGDLVLGSRYGIAPRTDGGYTAPGDRRPTALLVGGAVDFAGSAADGVLKVSGDAYVKVGDLSGSTTLATGMDGAPVKTRLVAAGRGYGTTPRVELTTAQASASVGPAPGLIDFGALFADHRRRADALARCPGTVTPRGALGRGATVRIRLADDRTNVLRLTGTQLTGIRSLAFENRPAAGRPLVVVVDTGAEGDVLSWRPPATTGLGAGDAPYVLWTFAGTKDLTLTAGDTLRGSLYAPRADLTDRSPADIEGDIVVRSFRAGPGAGGIRSAAFAAEPECGSAPAPASGPSRDRSVVPGAVVPGAGAKPEPGPEAKPGTDPGPDGEPGREAEAGVGPGTGREPDPEAKPGPGAAAEAEAGPGPGSRAPATAAVTDARPGSGPSPAESFPRSAEEPSPGAGTAMADTGSRSGLWYTGAGAALLVAVGTALTRASRRGRREPGE
ncbi:collagen-binding domain-containing protein [Streptomyces lavendulocolor]|uniref:collagen-binding domain-containing protein n=1 Tax=Streptomyces lavendulocolor TaxID=67316 RepID=UPI0031D28AAD